MAETDDIIVTGVIVGLLLLLTIAMLWHKPELPEKKKSPERVIFLAHVVSGVLHASSAVAFGIVTFEESIVWEAPVTVTYMYWQNATEASCEESGRCYSVAQTQHLHSLPIAILAILFGGISGMIHLGSVMVYPGIQRLYDEHISKGHNWTRWVDYSITASIMMVVVATLFSVSELYLLVAIAATQAYFLIEAGYFEYAITTSTKPPMLKTKYLIICILYVVAVWAPVIGTFYMLIHDDDIKDKVAGTAPEWVQVIVWGIFGLYSLFVANFSVYLIMDIPSKMPERQAFFARSELRYIALSLTSKILLHWTLFVGIQGRSGVLHASEQAALDDTLPHRTNTSDNKTLTSVYIAAACSISVGIVVWLVARWSLDKAIS